MPLPCRDPDDLLRKPSSRRQNRTVPLRSLGRRLGSDEVDGMLEGLRQRAVEFLALGDQDDGVRKAR